jgi:nucleoside-diphosphate-sugar epimerase
MLVNSVRLLNQYSKNPQNFCFLSSGGAIYGRSPGIVSELSPANPETFYGEMKLECEQFLKREKELGNINLKILRLANAYGSAITGLNRNLIDVVMNEPRLMLSAKTTSAKQYGTFDDYSRNILRLLGSTAYEKNDEVVKNIFPHHQYSIGEIIELVDTFRPDNNKIIVDFVSEKLSEETVILQNSSGSEITEDSWESLENYLSRKFPSRL